MSLKIIKAGMLDNIQDIGRTGFAEMGINPSGAMDMLAMQVANALAGNALSEAVLEMHFPAAAFEVEQDLVMAIAGADFEAVMEDAGGVILMIGPNKTFLATKGSKINFLKKQWGERCYLAVHGGFDLPDWMGSKSTNLKIGQGGLKGSALKREDRLIVNGNSHYRLYQNKVFPWSANVQEYYQDQPIQIIYGPEWDWLDAPSKNKLLREKFTIAAHSDRMGIALKGISLQLENMEQLVSSGVVFGTIQLLPSGQLMILAADHPTTGGYPRIANIVTAHLPALVQLKPGTTLRFVKGDEGEAFDLMADQHNTLQSIQQAVRFNLQSIVRG